MTSRSSRLGVLLIAAMALMALSAAGDIRGDHGLARHESGDRAVVHSPWVDATLALAVERREPGVNDVAQRGLLLWTVAASLLLLAVGCRQALVLARAVGFRVSWRSRASVRAPPLPDR